MRKSWFKYYKDHKGIIISNILLHWPYLLKIIILQPKKVLEIGCGPADHSVFLSHIKPDTNISLLDNDKNIILSLRKKLKKIGRFLICNITIKKEVDKQKFHLNEFDLIYSQGLMEHFPKKSFQTIINNFLPYTKKILISIPSEKYPNRDYGNELLRSEEELASIIKPIKNIKFKISKYFPDIGLRTKIIKINKEKISFLSGMMVIFTESFHYLIEIAKIK